MKWSFCSTLADLSDFVLYPCIRATKCRPCRLFVAVRCALFVHDTSIKARGFVWFVDAKASFVNPQNKEEGFSFRRERSFSVRYLPPWSKTVASRARAGDCVSVVLPAEVRLSEPDLATQCSLERQSKVNKSGRLCNPRLSYNNHACSRRNRTAVLGSVLSLQ